MVAVINKIQFWLSSQGAVSGYWKIGNLTDFIFPNSFFKAIEKLLNLKPRSKLIAH